MVNSILGKVPDYEEDIRRLMKTEKIDFSAAINDLLKSHPTPQPQHLSLRRKLVLQRMLISEGITSFRNYRRQLRRGTMPQPCIFAI